MEGVIEGLMNAPGNTVKCRFSFITFIHSQITHLFMSVTDLIKPPDLSQARVNKCLIALVNRKAVQKENNTVHINFFLATLHNLRRLLQGTVLYHWQGIP